MGLTNQADKDRIMSWEEDIEYLKKELPSKHYNLFFKLSRNEFNGMLDKLKLDLPRLSDDEIQIRIAEVIAAVGDTHTYFGGLPSVNTSDYFPIKTYWFKDGLYVIGIDKAYEQYLGSRLIKINNIPIQKVMDDVNTLISHENEAQLMLSNPNLIMNPSILNYFKIIQDDSSAVFSFEMADKSIIDVKIEAMYGKRIKYISALDNLKEKPLYMSSDKWFWYQYLPDKKLLYVQYNQCWDRNLEKQYRRFPNVKIEDLPDFEAFTNDLISFINKNDIDKLVFDIRNNEGGNSVIGSKLVKKISKIEKVNQKDKLFVIVGRATFSSAILNTLDFVNETKAIFFGEPTKGKPNHYGEVLGFFLPNSKIYIGYSSKYFKNYHKDIDTFVPDIIIEPTYEEWSKGIDPVMEAVMAY